MIISVESPRFLSPSYLSLYPLVFVVFVSQKNLFFFRELIWCRGGCSVCLSDTNTARAVPMTWMPCSEVASSSVLELGSSWYVSYSSRYIFVFDSTDAYQRYQCAIWDKIIRISHIHIVPIFVIDWQIVDVHIVHSVLWPAVPCNVCFKNAWRYKNTSACTKVKRVMNLLQTHYKLANFQLLMSLFQVSTDM